ncbi:unnamed protein product [Candida verbasci]|uniref:DUF833-domain-containing protein n=1 Tax=Candida verbasci TaxID=1227364 RepID=A0A9W4TQX8_9ASCO|nr:unnamed protein product [Candida verbasci]
MCIAIATTNHPDYPFILLSNRDEFFKRPTKQTHVHNINPNPSITDDDNIKILSPLDLARPEHGTWIGTTSNGKFAVLVNYREVDNQLGVNGEVSRGVLPLDYLSSNESDIEWKNKLNSRIDLSKIGGFTLLYGHLKINQQTGKINPLSIISNRGHYGKIFESETTTNGIIGTSCDVKTNEDDDIIAISSKTFGLSNSLFNEPWNKVEIGEKLLDQLIKKAIVEKQSQQEIVTECFKLLSHNTYNPKYLDDNEFDTKLNELKNSIFIPPLLRNEGYKLESTTIGKYYGTRTQTVILFDKFGNLNYYEKNIHKSDNLEEKDDTINHFKVNTNNNIIKKV